MQEPLLDLSAVTWTPKKEVVRIFYKDLWDKPDLSLLPSLFHEQFTFRGSLGVQFTGFDHFSTYVNFIHDAFDCYASDILALIEEGPQVAAKLRFHGYHSGPLFGQPPTGRHVWWDAMSIFSFEGQRIRDLWVLGDMYGLIERLRGEGNMDD